MSLNLREMMSQMHMGMPSGPSAAPAPKPKADPGAALKAAHAAHSKGDHHGAKKHALQAVNALHRLSNAAPAAGPAGPVGGAPVPPGAC